MLPAGLSTWLRVQGYSTVSTFAWNTTGAPAGTEHFGIWVRDGSSGAAYDSYVSLPFTMT
jgi:hypothetical protein